MAVAQNQAKQGWRKPETGPRNGKQLPQVQVGALPLPVIYFSFYRFNNKRNDIALFQAG